MPDVQDPLFWNKVLNFDSSLTIGSVQKRFKKEKKLMANNDKLQVEFIKDLQIVF